MAKGKVQRVKTPYGGQSRKGLIPVKEITITRAEGFVDEIDKPVTLIGSDAWLKADSLLRRWSSTAPKGGGYDKCDFSVKFADGETYNGRYDLKHYSIESPNLAQHVYDFVRFHAGQWSSWMNEKQYAEFMARNRLFEESKKFLATYAIGSKNIPKQTAITKGGSIFSSRTTPRITPMTPRLRR